MENPAEEMVLRTSALNEEDLYCLYKVRHRASSCLKCVLAKHKCVWLLLKGETAEDFPEEFVTEEEKPKIVTPKTRSKGKGTGQKRKRGDSIDDFLDDSDETTPPPRVKVPKTGEPGSSRYMVKAEKEGSVPGTPCAAKGMAVLVAKVKDYKLRSRMLLKLSELGCGACDHE